MINDFANSKSSAYRKLFIEFCKFKIETSSWEHFRSALLDNLMPLASDKTPSVRVRFINKIVPILYKHYGALNTSLVIELISIVDGLKFDKD